MKKISIYIVLLLFGSCGSLATIIDSTEKRVYDTVDFNKQQKAEVGNSMIISGIEEFEKTVILTEEVRTFGNYYLKEGDEFILEAENEDFLFFTDKYNVRNNSYSIAKNKETKEYFFATRSALDAFNVSTNRPVKVDESLIAFEDCKECYKKELVYNGKSGNTINILYREYKGNLARPVFFQNIQYDLNDSKTIGIQGVRIDVVDANNTTITYIVKKGFD